MSAAGMLIPEAVGRRVVLRVQHKGLTRSELMTFFGHRWAEATISASPSMPPISTVHMLLMDRITLALTRRGIEPLRIVVPPQGEWLSRVHPQTCSYIEPMPILF